MNKKKYKESSKNRLERIRLCKTTITKVVPNKKNSIYKREKNIDVDKD